MFENVLYQNATNLLSEDIAKDRLPGSILFSGPASSGKLTAALELARVIACKETPKGDWNCRCESCMMHKALLSPSLLVVGSGNRTLEIAAARNTLLTQNARNTSHVEASRYLYLRAVRKLTIRFSPILWQDDDKLSKFSPLLQSISEALEELSPERTLPEGDELEKILDSVGKDCEKLEGSYLYESLPVLQIRNFSYWAHLSSNSGKKVLIIEHADKMADSSRNALLKILEEPPEDTMFILTTDRRGAMLPTILSRVRTYTFFNRSVKSQQEVIKRVFHYDPITYGGPMPSHINTFLQSHLPVSPENIKVNAQLFFKSVAEGHVPNIPAIMSVCGNFKPGELFKIFVEELMECQKPLLKSAAGVAASAEINDLLRESCNNVNVYNQNVMACLEELTRSIMQVNRTHGGILKEIAQSSPSEE